MGFPPARLGHIHNPTPRHFWRSDAKANASSGRWCIMGNIDEYTIGMTIYAVVLYGRFFVWALGCFACCVLIATAPIGALLCRRWACQQGWDASRCAWLGAFYWAGGFIPWVHFAFQINGRMPPPGLMGTTYTALFFAWLAGPVSIGIFDTIWVGRWFLELLPVTWLPIANLLAFIAALVCLVKADELPATPERVDTYRVIPSVLGSLAMLSGFAWAPLFFALLLY